MYLTEDMKIELAHSTHAGMLHDNERHQKYYDALKLTVEEVKAEKRGSIYALDIGGGTGILSMMAATAGCDHVTTCESSKPTSEVAEKIIKTNKLDEKVAVICKSSTELSIPQDMDVKADILVTEIFDTELLGEGVLPTLRDAHERLTHEHCKVIPECAHVNIQLIESNRLWCMNKIEFQHLDIACPNSFDDCRGWAAGYEVQINQLYPKDLKLLCEARKMKTFSFIKPFYHSDSCDGVKYSSSTIQVEVTTPGVLHGVLFWWDLVLHGKGAIVLSLKPDWLMRNNEKSTWREHWMQAVYYLARPLNVTANDRLLITMFHDDYSIWFDVTIDTSLSNISGDAKHQENALYIERPLCSCGLHVTCPREKFSMLNNPDMHLYFRELLSKFERFSGLDIAILGDMSILPLLFSKNGFKKLKYIECNPFSKRTMTKLLEYNEVCRNIDMIDINSALTSSIQSDVIICEPYFSSSLLPWQHLRIWKHLYEIKSCSGRNLKKFPVKAVLKSCLVYFKEFWKIRKPVQNIDVFDLSDYDKLLENVLSPLEVEGHGDFQGAEPYLMWEYEHEIKSDVHILKEFVLIESPPETHCSFQGKINSSTGSYNAVVVWMDFEMDKELYFYTGLNKQKEWVGYSKQGIYFLSKPTCIEGNISVDYNVLFDPLQYEFLFSFSPCD